MTIKNLEKNIKIRQENFKTQCDYFDKYSMFFQTPKESDFVSTAWLAFPILLKEGIPFSRKQFQIYLEERNIQTRVVFTGNILRQPGFKNIKAIRDKKGYPEADKVMKNGILLACHHGLTKKMIPSLQKIVGIRPGEKLHEQMVGPEDAYYTFEYPEHFKILPAINDWYTDPERIKNGIKVAEGFQYASDNNLEWMTEKELLDWVDINKQKIGRA